MSKRQNLTIVAAGYVLIGLIAFGHCAAEAREREERCIAAGDSREECSRGAPLRGLFAGALWPLYLSWELQS